jgi:hypothetical protein
MRRFPGAWCEEVSRSMVVLQSTRVYSYDTGYLDMSWVITDVELDEDDE